MIDFIYKPVNNGSQMSIILTNGILSPLLNVAATTEKNAHTSEKIKLKIGDKMDNGAIYAGISPETDAPFYVQITENAVAQKFNNIALYPKNRLPTASELFILMEHDDNGLINLFNNNSCYYSSRYWVSNPIKMRGFIGNFIPNQHALAITYPNRNKLMLNKNEKAGIILICD